MDRCREMQEPTQRQALMGKMAPTMTPGYTLKTEARLKPDGVK